MINRVPVYEYIFVLIYCIACNAKQNYDITKANSLRFPKNVPKFVKKSCAMNCVSSYEHCKLRHVLVNVKN